MSKNKQTKKNENNKVNEKASNNNIRQPIPETMESIFGSISWLMLHSPAHRHLFISDYEWLIMPALQTRQFRIVRQNNRPVTYVSWAYLDEDTETRIRSNFMKLKPTEWKQGDRLWIIDIIAPFGGVKETLQKLNDTEFKGKKVNVMRPRKDGRGMEAVLLEDILRVEQESDKGEGQKEDGKQDK